MNPFFHAILASSVPQFDDSVSPALTVNDVTEGSVYWPHVYKSADWPEITTTKNYFILYSTDHDNDTDSSTSGGIYWGEFDSFTETGISGFVERGLILEGYQAETPYLVKVPTSVSGLASDTIFLYYHTYQDIGYVIDQETRLMTSTGGELHTATWTDRGRPLGNVSGEDHTGYAMPRFRDSDNKLVTNHQFDSSTPYEGKISTSTDGLTYSRVSQFLPTLNMPSGSWFNKSQINDFSHNGTLYGFINLKGENAGIAIAKLDPDTYLPSEFVKSILYYDIRDLRVYVENGIAYCLFKQGTSEDNGQPYYLWKYNLSNL